jgi:hypothetical protein
MKIITFPLSSMTCPRDICAKMTGIKYYTYTFHTATEVIKEGKASDDEWMAGTWGNRVYRQAGGIAGWYSELNDTSANKMREKMRQFFPTVTKDQVQVTVYDHTDELKNESKREIDRVLLNEENDRVRAHIIEHGVPPKLNIQATRARRKPMLPPDLFEFESV